MIKEFKILEKRPRLWERPIVIKYSISWNNLPYAKTIYLQYNSESLRWTLRGATAFIIYIRVHSVSHQEWGVQGLTKKSLDLQYLPMRGTHTPSLHTGIPVTLRRKISCCILKMISAVYQSKYHLYSLWPITKRITQWIEWRVSSFIFVPCASNHMLQ